MKDLSVMKNTIVKSIVAVICTAAICVTMALTLPKSSGNTTATGKEYMTASETAEYLGITEDVLEILRTDLKKLEGSYMTYTYLNDKGESVTEIVYQKSAVDSSIKALMDEAGAINVEFLQEKSAENK